jgi:hypothetical protein
MSKRGQDDSLRDSNHLLSKAKILFFPGFKRVLEIKQACEDGLLHDQILLNNHVDNSKYTVSIIFLSLS